MRTWGTLATLLAVLTVAACTGGTEGADSIQLPTEVFDPLDSPVLSMDEQQAILAGDQPGPAYNSDPPTSGPHADDFADCGVYRVEIPDIYQVHSLKRGTVIVQYQPTLQAATLEALEDLTRALGHNIIVAPRSTLPAPIVLTAWTRRLAMSEADADMIRAFHEQFATGAPEYVDCPLTVTLAE